MLLKANEKMLMMGDSITDCGRAQPVGEGLCEPYGRGYVNLFNGLLGATYPELGVRVINLGSSGHTSRELKDRWEADVLARQPDWVTCMIGVNDVWRQFDLPQQKEIHVMPAEFEANLESVVKQTVDKVKGFVLLAPFFMELNRKDAMRAQVDVYGAIVQKIARKYKTHFVDTQAAFDKALEHYYPATLGWDRVHPSTVGHMIIARELMRELGYQWK